MTPAAFKQAIETLRASQEQRLVPCISAHNAQFITQLLQQKTPSHILEIGSCEGLSTAYIAQAVLPWAGNLSTLELSPVNYGYAVENIQKLGFSNVTMLNVDALDWLATHCHTCFDFVFIDAQKSKTLAFFLAVIPHLRAGSTIVIDDVIKYQDKMVGFFEYLQMHGIRYTLHPVDAGDATMVIDR